MFFFVSASRRGCPKLVFCMADVFEVLSRLSMSKRRDRTFNSPLTAGWPTCSSVTGLNFILVSNATNEQHW